MKNQILQKTEQEIKIQPFKTALEQELAEHYIEALSYYDVVPNVIVEAYLRDIEIIRLEKPIYNENLN